VNGIAPKDVPTVELDRVHLEELLQRFGGRVAEMARHAGISRPKLYRLLWAEGLDPAQFRLPMKEAR
jgi:DNA-binding NtrC family response regulator